MGATLPLVIKSAVARRSTRRRPHRPAVCDQHHRRDRRRAGRRLLFHLRARRSRDRSRSPRRPTSLIGVDRDRAPATPAARAGEHAATAPEQAIEAGPATTQQRLVLWTFFVSGVMSLALEIIWFRMLVIFLRPTAYAFTIMLACVLAGIALGSAIAAPLLRHAPPLAADPRRHPGRDRLRRGAVVQHAGAGATRRSTPATPWFDGSASTPISRRSSSRA